MSAKPQWVAPSAPTSPARSIAKRTAAQHLPSALWRAAAETLSILAAVGGRLPCAVMSAVLQRCCEHTSGAECEKMRDLGTSFVAQRDPCSRSAGKLRRRIPASQRCLFQLANAAMSWLGSRAQSAVCHLGGTAGRHRARSGRSRAGGRNCRWLQRGSCPRRPALPQR